MPSNFRFNSQRAFLTYPKCTYTKEDVLSWFEDKFGTLDGFCVSRELHADGTPHIHAYFKFNRKLNLSSESCFDLVTDDNEDGYWHPNIQRPRSDKHVINYVKKDSDYIASANIDEIINAEEESWGSIRKKAKTSSEFMEMVSVSYTRDYVLNHEKLEYFCNKTYGQSRYEYVSPPEIIFPRLPPPVAEWAMQYVLGPINIGRPKCLILVGPSRTGKSMWSRSLGTHMYFQGMFNLDDWDDSARYAVFDDIDWKFFPSKKQFIGCQSNFVLTDRYRKKKTVMYGLPGILCMNEDNYSLMREDTMYSWILMNAKIVEVNSPFF